MVNGTKKKTPKMLQEFNLAVLIVDVANHSATDDQKNSLRNDELS